jgi:hypothetical protein
MGVSPDFLAYKSKGDLGNSRTKRGLCIAARVAMARARKLQNYKAQSKYDSDSCLPEQTKETSFLGKHQCKLSKCHISSS